MDLPFREDEPRTVGLHRPDSVGASSAEPTAQEQVTCILIVDDDSKRVVLLRKLLRPLRLDIATARSGSEAIAQLRKLDPAVILLDVKMPDMDGFETARTIRQEARTRNTPIIFMSAYDQEELDIRRAYSLGAVDFIVAPVVPHILLGKVRVFVQLEQQRREISRLLAIAQESSSRMTQFLNMAAHELRTPLSVVTGYLSLLRDGSLGAAPMGWDDPLRILEQKSGELNTIVEDLLAAARIESGTWRLTPTLVDLRTVVDDAVGRARARAALLGGTVTTELPDQTIAARVDVGQIRRIIANLIDNALTYCDCCPEVKVTLSSDAGPVIRVRDNGIGVPDQWRERVFDRFFRVSDGATQHPGTGLGLYIGQQLASAHGGILTLEHSSLGAGSVFRLQLPRDGISSEEPVPIGVSVMSAAGPTKVLALPVD